MEEFVKLKMLDGVAMKPGRTAGLFDARKQVEIVLRDRSGTVESLAAVVAALGSVPHVPVQPASPLLVVCGIASLLILSQPDLGTALVIGVTAVVDGYARLWMDGSGVRILGEVGAKRIAVQIEPDGRQPLELERTKGWSYSIMNVRGLMQLARLGEHVGVELWHAHTADERGIPAALDFLVPFATGERPWPYEQLNGFRPEGAVTLLRRAAVQYPDGPYAAAVAKPSRPSAVESTITVHRPSSVLVCQCTRRPPAP